MKSIELFSSSNYPGRYYLDLTGFYDSIHYKKLVRIVKIAENPGWDALIEIRKIAYDNNSNID